MKKYFLIPVLFILCFSILLPIFAEKSKENKAMDDIIRLHVRAADDSPEEQALKLKVRDEILNVTCDLLAQCNNKTDAKNLITSNLDRLKTAGQTITNQWGKNHTISVSLGREHFEYREYDGFFLPAGEYDSLIVEIGPGEGKNWWCVVFPAACYMGAAEVKTDESKMPECFQLAKSRNKTVTVKFWLWEKIQEIFD